MPSGSNRQKVADAYPLSALQEGLLYHHELDPGASTYWNKVTCTLTGTLDHEKLQAAWQHAVDRNSVLRTSFTRDRKGRALQLVKRRADVDWTYGDLSGLNPAEQERSLSAAQGTVPAHLGRDTLFRIKLFKLDASVHRLCWYYHHILLDGWSESLLWDSVMATYADLKAGRAPAAGEGVPYSAYIAWTMQGSGPAAKRFWSHYLADYAPFDLASPDRASAAATARFARTQTRFQRPFSDTLRAFGRANGLTLNTILQGALALALTAETGRSDIVYGVTVSDRPAELAGSQEMVGLLLATLPVRFATDSTSSVVDWLHRCQSAFASIREHTRMPLPEIKIAARLDAKDTLFDLLFSMDGFDLPVDGAGDLVVGELRRAGGTNYGLSMLATAGECIDLVVGYDANRYTHDWVARLLERLHTTAAGMVRHAVDPLVDVALLDGPEIDRLRSLDASCDVPVPGEVTIAHLVATACRERAAAPAIESGDTTLTYAALHERVGEIAGSLVEAGIGPGQAVGVLLPRSTDCVAGILAIWRVGAVYVPFDPNHPRARIERNARTADVRALVTHGRLPASIEHLAPCIDLGSLPAGRNPAAPIAAAPAQTAYIMFTSGSTGVPNGVPITHGSLLNMVSSLASTLRVARGDRLVAVSNTCFDISLFELLAPLLAGATVRIAASEALTDPRLLRQEVEAADVTIQFATPAVWEVLLLEGWQPRAQQRLLTGGEALREDVAEQLLAQGSELWNLYGPTETTIASTAGRIESADRIDIGGPLANTRLRVVDPGLRPLPPGVFGELCIGGAGVSGGYLGAAELTRRRFVMLCGTKDHERWFRTGDVAALTSEGRVRFGGRLDDQIKLRGLRIEPGEIEAALNALPEIATSVVVARANRAGARQIVAYVVSASGAANWSRVTAELAKQVPRYMIPSHFVALEALPLTPNGKVDRKALPDPDSNDGGVDPGGFTATETAVAEIWRDLLDIPCANNQADFFALGGHSLVLAKLASRLEHHFDCALSIGDLATNTTLASQAHMIDELRSASVSTRQTSIQPRYFGAEERVFGVIYPARGARREHAVVVAGPLLNEGIRAHLVLQKVCANYAERGFDVLRFDYRGTGNAIGPSDRVAPEDWEQDVADALELAGAGRRGKLSIIAVRFAANLVLRSTREHSIDHLVLWDPVASGDQWLESLRRARARVPGHLQNLLGPSEFLGHTMAGNFAERVAARTWQEPLAAKLAVLTSADYPARSLPAGLDPQVLAHAPDWASWRSSPIFSTEVFTALCRSIP